MSIAKPHLFGHLMFFRFCNVPVLCFVQLIYLNSCIRCWLICLTFKSCYQFQDKKKTHDLWNKAFHGTIKKRKRQTLLQFKKSYWERLEEKKRKEAEAWRQKITEGESEETETAAKEEIKKMQIIKVEQEKKLEKDRDIATKAFKEIERQQSQLDGREDSAFTVTTQQIGDFMVKLTNIVPVHFYDLTCYDSSLGKLGWGSTEGSPRPEDHDGTAQYITPVETTDFVGETIQVESTDEAPEVFYTVSEYLDDDDSKSNTTQTGSVLPVEADSSKEHFHTSECDRKDNQTATLQSEECNQPEEVTRGKLPTISEQQEQTEFTTKGDLHPPLEPSTEDEDSDPQHISESYPERLLPSLPFEEGPVASSSESQGPTSDNISTVGLPDSSRKNGSVATEPEPPSGEEETCGVVKQVEESSRMHQVFKDTELPKELTRDPSETFRGTSSTEPEETATLAEGEYPQRVKDSESSLTDPSSEPSDDYPEVGGDSSPSQTGQEAGVGPPEDDV